MTSDPSDLDAVKAHHESGHAVVCVALRLPLLRLRLDPPRYDLADGSHPRLPRLLALMGGGAAEELVYGHAVGTASDDTEIREMLRPGEDEAVLRDQVRALLRWNAGTLRLLAARLLRERIMTGGAVERLVRGR